jgi:hypothetical protein
MHFPVADAILDRLKLKRVAAEPRERHRAMPNPRRVREAGRWEPQVPPAAPSTK